MKNDISCVSVFTDGVFGTGSAQEFNQHPRLSDASPFA